MNRVCTFESPVKEIQNSDSVERLLTGQVNLRETGLFNLSSAQFNGLKQTGQSAPDSLRDRTLVSDFGGSIKPTSLMFGSSALGAGGLQHSAPLKKGPENNNQGNGEGNDSNNTGDGNNEGGGKEGGGGGAGGKNGPQPQSNPGGLQLVIKIDPSKFSVPDPPQQTENNCQQPFLKYYRTLFDKVVCLPSYDWFNNENLQQFFACSVIRCSQSSIPAALISHDYDDFFDYDRNNTLARSSLTSAVSNVLSGVDCADPSSYFTPFDQLDRVDQPDEVALRPGIVLMCSLIEDLAEKAIKVKVEYRFGIDADGDPN